MEFTIVQKEEYSLIVMIYIRINDFWRIIKHVPVKNLIASVFMDSQLQWTMPNIDDTGKGGYIRPKKWFSPAARALDQRVAKYN